MKVVLIEKPKFISAILRKIYGIKRKPSRNNSHMFGHCSKILLLVIVYNKFEPKMCIVTKTLHILFFKIKL